MSADYIPRRLHDQNTLALTERCITAETSLKALLNYIDPAILERNGFDWAAAVIELVPAPKPAPRPAPAKALRKR